MHSLAQPGRLFIRLGISSYVSKWVNKRKNDYWSVKKLLPTKGRTLFHGKRVIPKMGNIIGSKYYEVRALCLACRWSTKC
jgi:hypothetical protein